MNHSKAALAIVVFHVAAALMLEGCNNADASRPPICRDAATTTAVVDAAIRLRHAQDEQQRIAMGGNGIDAAKVGPIPGPDLDAAMVRIADEVRAARENLIAIRRHCMEQAESAGYEQPLRTGHVLRLRRRGGRGDYTFQ